MPNGLNSAHICSATSLLPADPSPVLLKTPCAPAVIIHGDGTFSPMPSRQLSYNAPLQEPLIGGGVRGTGAWLGVKAH